MPRKRPAADEPPDNVIPLRRPPPRRPFRGPRPRRPVVELDELAIMPTPAMLEFERRFKETVAGMGINGRLSLGAVLSIMMTYAEEDGREITVNVDGRSVVLSERERRAVALRISMGNMSELATNFGRGLLARMMGNFASKPRGGR